jgi:hypothetical protein
MEMVTTKEKLFDLVANNIKKSILNKNEQVHIENTFKLDKK